MNQLLFGINKFILNPLIGLLFVVALIVFFWGLVQFIGNAGSEDARQKGKRNIMWGIIGMFIMISVFGIIKIILGTFGIDSGTGGSFGLPSWIFR